MNQTQPDPQKNLLVKNLFRWSVMSLPLSVVTGLLVAVFLWLLGLATTTRWQHLWLIFFLPLAGIIIVALYHLYGKNSGAGNNLVIDEIHEPGGGVPARMTPLILCTTVITHLFGGSAGREGTAVQMGGSMGALFSRWFKLEHADRRIVLMCGMSAGFGAVFGTPFAGAVFALEVLTVGVIKYDALIPCLVAGMVADFVCTHCGIHHTAYHISVTANGTGYFSHIAFSIFILGKVIVAGILFGCAARMFAYTTHEIKEQTRKWISNPWIIPVAGGILLIAISYILGTFDYLGLGVTNPSNGVSIVSSFSANGADTFSWFWKLLLTAITLGTGFKGGEVTPLFFIGATLGNTLATLSGSPVDLFAALGFIAVFAGATNTPVACTLMGMELFGAENTIYYAVACFAAYYVSGNKGIYTSQRVGASKFRWYKRKKHQS